MTNNHQLAAEERAALIADCKQLHSQVDFWGHCSGFDAEKLILITEIALASLEAKPASHFYHEKEGGWYEIMPGDKVPENRIILLYTAPPVAVMQPVVLAKDLKVSEKAHQSHIDYAEGYNDRAEMDRKAIRAAGGSVKE